jgi:hypothetical protein
MPPANDNSHLAGNELICNRSSFGSAQALLPETFADNVGQRTGRAIEKAHNGYGTIRLARRGRFRRTYIRSLTTIKNYAHRCWQRCFWRPFLARWRVCNTIEGAGKSIQRGGAAITDEAREHKN